MSEEVDDGIKQKPAKDNPWYDFLLESIELDKGDDGARESKPYGWHWFWGIYGLYREIPTFPQLNIDVIKKQLPDNRCINFNPYEEEQLSHPESKHACEMQQEATNALYKILKESNSLKTVKKIDFSKCNFPEYADLSYIIFPIDTSFEHTSFSIEPNFSNTIFCDKVSFSRAVFTDNVFFNEAQFFNEASFTGTRFRHKVFSDPCFDKAVFSGRALFTFAEFEGHIFFKETIFSRDAIFQDTKFTFQADFRKAEFIESAIFTNATFSNDVRFDGTHFCSLTFFDSTKFHGEALFYNAKFDNSAMFKRAEFFTLAVFGKADISGSINFIDTHFKTRVPYFHDAKIGTGVLWDRNDKLWPQTKQDNETDAKYKNRIANNQNDYEVLVSHMQKLDKHDDEHFFFRQVMRWRRLDNKLTHHPSKKYFNWKLIEDNLNIFFFQLYYIFADYGYGIGRSFAWWAGHIVLGAVILFVIRSVDRLKMSLDDFGCSLGISLSNSHGFFFMGEHLNDCYTKFKYLSFFTTIWTTQTVLGIIFLFLFLLTLRTRFRLK